MGKKGKRSGFGGSGSRGGGGGGGGGRGGAGGGGPRGASAGSAGLVVVNPMLLQSMASRGGGGHAAAKQQQQKKKQPKPKQQPPKKRKHVDKDGEEGEKRRKYGDALGDAQQQPKRAQKPRPGDQKMVAAVSQSVGSLFQLQVAREDQTLAALYWVLLTRGTRRSAVVAIPNVHATLSPTLVAQALKSLGFQALSLHSKMTPGQRKQNVERLVEQSKGGGHAGADKFVLVTNEHWFNTTACPNADLVALGSTYLTKAGVETKYATVFVVHADAASPVPAASYEKPLPGAAIPQLQARVKLATQIATVVQSLGSAAATAQGNDAEAKWATKFARGADLSDDEDDDGSAKKKNTKKGQAPSPDEQRLRALNEKMLVLLARSITANPHNGAPASKASAAASDDAQHRAEKLQTLGLVVLSAASSGDGERLSAQTQWLDGAAGAAYGGDWDGAVRHGASKDKTSLAVRHRVCECLGGSGKKSSKKTAQNAPTQQHLQQWRPNRQPADVDAWGGAYGKVCGHNEVVMQHLRPFFPQQVLNSRVCSKRQPAPGNQGFDGCLEFLRLACLGGGRCMTVWDAESFVFISASGRVSAVAKLQFLTLPLAGLQTLVANLRQWTLACDGRRSPLLLLESIRLCCRLGADDVASSRLADAKLVRRVLAFAVGGSTRVWKQIAKMPAPIASEVVYEPHAAQ